MRRKLLLNYFLLFCSIVCTFLLLELFFRFLAIDNDLYYQKLTWNHWLMAEMPETYNRLYQYDKILGYERKEVNVAIDRIMEEKPLSYKILVLGDSITQWGKYVDYFTQLLHEQYNNKDVEVINAGVMGYDTELEYRFLKYRGLRLKPDLLILQFCVNDFRGTPLIIQQESGQWMALEKNFRLNNITSSALFRHSKLCEFICIRLLYFLHKQKSVNELKANVKEPLRMIKDLMMKTKTPFYIILFPYLTENANSQEYEMMLKIIKELGLEHYTIGLREEFSKAGFENIRKDAIHPNQEGDKLAANALFVKMRPFFESQL
jgi:lysophospholipase L1-like esterase